DKKCLEIGSRVPRDPVDPTWQSYGSQCRLPIKVSGCTSMLQDVRLNSRHYFRFKYDRMRVKILFKNRLLYCERWSNSISRLRLPRQISFPRVENSFAPIFIRHPSF